MCGITGFAGNGDHALLSRMCASIQHRGPDEDGFYEAPGIALAMRRLSIIDLKGGTQPIFNEDRTVVIVFNGEIYNYQELTAELQARGHVFSTRSDTETIVHLYEEYGLDFVQRLRGMFAIALWDVKRRRLVLVRDRIGEKPLYYKYDSEAGTLLFGSEIKCILQQRTDRAINPQAVCQFMAAGYVPAPTTFYQGIEKLPQGCMLVYEHGKAQVSTYWQLQPGGRVEISLDEARSRLSELLVESVQLCLKSDVEVGSFLSGGLDSSLITGIMRRLGATVQTFSVGYQGAAEGFNELSYAKRVAAVLGTTHHELILQPVSTIEMLPRILWHFDEPHGEPSSVLVYLLSEFTRQRLKVAMGGTGSDEIFYGYPKHGGLRMLQYYRMLPRILREGVLERIVNKWPESTKGSRFAKRAKRFIHGASLAPEQAYLRWTSLLSTEVRDRLLTDRVTDDVDDPGGDAFLLAWLTAPDRGGVLERVTDMEVSGYLPNFQLTYMDRMSMANSLEVRSPFCDWKLVEFVTGLPTRYRLKRNRSKHILKSVATEWVPRDIVERRKVGFDSPIGQWMKDELRGFVGTFLSPEQISRTGLFAPDTVQELIGDHLAGRRDYSLQLWSLMMVEAWHRMFIEDGVMDLAGYSLKNMRGSGMAAG
jgi:asparagine synthase (glutamine-hydrolysing)